MSPNYINGYDQATNTLDPNYVANLQYYQDAGGGWHQGTQQQMQTEQAANPSWGTQAYGANGQPSAINSAASTMSGGGGASSSPAGNLSGRMSFGGANNPAYGNVTRNQGMQYIGAPSSGYAQTAQPGGSVGGPSRMPIQGYNTRPQTRQVINQGSPLGTDSGNIPNPEDNASNSANTPNYNNTTWTMEGGAVNNGVNNSPSWSPSVPAGTNYYQGNGTFNPVDPNTWWTGGAGAAASSQWLQNQTAGNANQVQSQLGPAQTNLQNYLNTYDPGSQTSAIYQLLNQMGIMGTQGLNTAQNGQANTGALQGQTANTSQLGQNMLGGNGSYGLTDFYNQLLNQGLPNQSLINSLAPSQSTYGQNMQGGAQQSIQNLLSGGQAGGQSALGNQTSQTLQQMLQTGGMSPDYVAAMQRTVLDPAQQQMTGQVNQLAGGGSLLTSPEYQELMRRNQQNFTDTLLTQGQQNMNNYLGQANTANTQNYNQGLNTASLQGQLGQQGISNTLNSYGVGSSAPAVYTGQAAGLSNDLLSQALSGYMGTGTMGNQTNANAQNMLSQSTTAGQNLLNSNLNTQSGLNSNLLEQYLGNLGIYGGNANTNTSAQAGVMNANTMANGQVAAANAGATGNAIGSAMSVAPDILSILASIFGL